MQENYISEEDYENLYNQNEVLKSKLNNIYQQEKNIYNENINYQKNNINNNYINQEELFAKQQSENLKYQEELQRAREKAYHDAYIQDLKNRGYKIKYKKLLRII